MKSLSLFTSAVVLLSATSAFAITCDTLPSCGSLGYNDKKAECPASKFLACPFDTDTGKCVHDAAIGDLKYSLKTADHDGWVLCNGQGLDKTIYNKLYAILGTNYGSEGNKFRVPDYRGFFLRGYGTAINNKPLSSYGGEPNNSLKDPQKEQLPNITGSFPGDDSQTGGQKINNTYHYPSGAFSAGSSVDLDHDSSGGKGGKWINFRASNSNSIYSGTHVIPANYAANIFIYAGK